MKENGGGEILGKREIVWVGFGRKGKLLFGCSVCKIDKSKNNNNVVRIKKADNVTKLYLFPEDLINPRQTSVSLLKVK